MNLDQSLEQVHPIPRLTPLLVASVVVLSKSLVVLAATIIILVLLAFLSYGIPLRSKAGHFSLAVLLIFATLAATVSVFHVVPTLNDIIVAALRVAPLMVAGAILAHNFQVTDWLFLSRSLRSKAIFHALLAAFKGVGVFPYVLAQIRLAQRARGISFTRSPRQTLDTLATSFFLATQEFVDSYTNILIMRDISSESLSRLPYRWGIKAWFLLLSGILLAVIPLVEVKVLG